MRAKKLGFGLMRLPTIKPDDPAAIDIEQLKKMVDLFLSKGFTYFDTAWMYGGFHSENAAKEALVDRHPRDSFTLATKLHNGFIETLADRDKIFNEQRKKTGADYFDYYLLHGISRGSIEKYEALNCFDWLLEKKAQGLVKHAGFSYHDDAALLDEILTRHPEMEFVQLQINYLDWDSPWIHSKEVYETAVRHGKPVIVMEPVKGGTLANLPEDAAGVLREADPSMSQASWAIRFAASLPGVMMVLSGMSNLEQMEDNIGFMEDLRPLTEKEQALCFRAAEIMRSKIAVPCTGCSYCTEGCPQKIAIPQYFSLYNEDMRETIDKWTVTSESYAHLAQKFGKAADCIGCGQCEGVCPQHLPIIEELKKVSAHFDR